METGNALPDSVIALFKKNPVLQRILAPDFDPFQHFALSESFDVDSTLQSVQEGLKLVDEELEILLAKNLPALRSNINALDKLKQMQRSLAALSADLQASLDVVKNSLESDLNDAKTDLANLKETKETLDTLRLLSSRVPMV